MTRSHLQDALLDKEKMKAELDTAKRELAQAGRAGERFFPVTFFQGSTFSELLQETEP